jgi:hypothetical protein
MQWLCHPVFALQDLLGCRDFSPNALPLAQATLKRVTAENLEAGFFGS